MIMHKCIKCDDFQMIPIAPLPLPRIQKYRCLKCGTLQWIYHSRIDPKTYADSEVEVDEKKKVVKLKEVKK